MKNTGTLGRTRSRVRQRGTKFSPPRLFFAFCLPGLKRRPLDARLLAHLGRAWSPRFFHRCRQRRLRGNTHPVEASGQLRWDADVPCGAVLCAILSHPAAGSQTLLEVDGPHFILLTFASSPHLQFFGVKRIQTPFVLGLVGRGTLKSIIPKPNPLLLQREYLS